MTQPVVTLGKFGAPFGIQGWIKVISYTDPPATLFDYNKLHYQDAHNNWHALKLTQHEQSKPHFIVQITQITDRDHVKAYTNLNIGVYREQLPKLTEDEFYCADLIGLAMETTAGIKLGMICELIQTGSNDVFLVKEPNIKKVRYIPYLTHVVKSIDLDKKLIIVDWDPDF